MLECLTRSSRLLTRNIINNYEMTICDMWHSTALNRLDSLMRLPRTIKPLVNNMAEEGRGDGLR
jgi:hypothetical protein